MTRISLVIVLIALAGEVGGQLFLKRAMGASNAGGFRSRQFVLPICAGILLMTMKFFLNLGLLQHYDLSFIYPFQGLSVIMVILSAAFTLREKLTFQLVTGSLLISAGVVLISLT